MNELPSPDFSLVEPEVSVPLEEVVNLWHFDLHGTALLDLGGVVPVVVRGHLPKRAPLEECHAKFGFFKVSSENSKTHNLKSQP